MVRSTNLQTCEATSRCGQESSKTETKGKEELINVRVAGKRGAGGDSEGRQVRQGDKTREEMQEKSNHSINHYHLPQSHRNKQGAAKL